MGKKVKLKTALGIFQEKQRRVQLQKVKEAAKKDVLKKSTSSPKSRGKRPSRSIPDAATLPVAASDTILLIGEGNFSFARALFLSRHAALEHLPPANVTATSYDSEETCYEKYPDGRQIVQELREKGVAVLFGVDARRLEACKALRKRKWRRVIWNFPHAGKGISDQDRNILSNQLLILDFLKSVAPLLEHGALPSRSPPKKARKRLQQPDAESDEDDISSSQLYNDHQRQQSAERGTVLITLRNSPPYTLWDVPRLAKKPPPPHVSSVSPAFPQPKYVQLRSFVFREEDWQGYEHRMTKGWVEGLGRGGGSGPGTIEDRTWEFCLADAQDTSIMI